MNFSYRVLWCCGVVSVVFKHKQVFDMKDGREVVEDLDPGPVTLNRVT